MISKRGLRLCTLTPGITGLLSSIFTASAAGFLNPPKAASLRQPRLPAASHAASVRHRGGDDAVGIPARQKQSVPGLLLWRGGSHPAGIRNRLCDGAAVQSPLLGLQQPEI